MRKNWNPIERANAWKKYIDAGHSERELARLLGKKSHSSVKDVLSLLGVRTTIQDKLEKDDTNWSWFKVFRAVIIFDSVAGAFYCSLGALYCCLWAFKWLSGVLLPFFRFRRFSPLKRAIRQE